MESESLFAKVACLSATGLLALTGCVTFGVASNDDSAAGAVHSRTAHSFLWGAVPGEAVYATCGMPGDPDGNGVWQTRTQMSGGHILASVLTVGIWTPVGVSWTCATPRPRPIGIGGPACSDLSAQDPAKLGCAPPTAAADPADPAALPAPPRALEEMLDCQEDATWSNFAGNVTVTPKKLCRPRPAARGTVAERAAPLVSLVREAESKNLRIRAVGAGWSFSHAAATDGIVVDMRWFGGSLPLPDTGDWAPGTADRAYAHFEAGAAVDSVNLALQNAGYSLFTMGGSAGQTWVGAVATGTHGGDTCYRAISDDLRALHVVTEGGKRLWIERASAPLSRGGFAKKIGAEFVQDDATFEAAVVGLGSFGIVHSAVIEVQKLESYLLWRQRFDYDDKLRHAMETFDFSGWTWPDPMQQALSRKKVLQQNTNRKTALRHFEVVVNPYETGAGGRGAFVTTVWDDNRFIAPSEVTGTPSNVNTRVGTVIVRILESKAAKEVPAALHVLLPSQYAEITTPLEGPLRTLFPKGIPTGGTPMSMELGASRSDVNKAMDVILKEIADHSTGYYYPGVVAFRFSEPTKALIGFTHFDTKGGAADDGGAGNVTIEFPTVAGVAGTEAFLARVVAALRKANIAFTQHPGQWNTYPADPALYRSDFGDKLTAWQAIRDKLLTPKARTLFANEYTDKIGLTSTSRPRTSSDSPSPAPAAPPR